MKFFLGLCMLVIVATAAPTDEEELLDNFDFEAVLGNDEQRKAIFDCLLDVKPCGDMQQLKDKTIKLIRNKCANCTPEQKEKYDRIIKKVHEKYDKEFKEFMKKVADMKQ